MKTIRCGMLLLGVCLLPAGVRADEPGGATWVEPMRKVHSRFKGTPGTFAHFGDSITVTKAFWSPLAYQPKNLDAESIRDLTLVKRLMKQECWRGWKGTAHGSNGSMTIR